MRCVTDVDECAVNNGGCNPLAICVNTPGSFTCSCMPGYIGDGFTCTGSIAAPNFALLICWQQLLKIFDCT